MIKRLIEVLSHDQKPWRRIAAKVIARSRLGQLLKIQIKVQDYAIFFHPTALSTVFWYDASARSEDSGFIRSFLQPGETYIDIGANIGVTVIPAAIKVGASGKVIAFEPHPKTAGYLAENIALNQLKNIEVRNCALGDTRGSISFTNKSSDDMNQVTLDQQSGIEVPIMLLDDFASEHEQIALLKLDVEGYEKFVLAGATAILSKVGCMYFEVDQQNFQGFGYNCQELLQQV
jgi:FkbM family methyltransferase